MPTATEDRCLISLTLPDPLYKILREESERTGMNAGALVRRIVKWHYGAANSRHQDSPPVTLKPRRTKPSHTKKGVLIDREDAEFIDNLGYRIGLPRTSVILLLILQYFDLAILPQKQRK